MKNTIIVLFILGFVELIVQDIRHLHVFAFKDEKPALYEFSSDYSETQNARSQESVDILKSKLKAVIEDIRKKETDKSPEQLKEMREKDQIYRERTALEVEIRERIDKGREIRNLWLFCGSGFLLILAGGAIFVRSPGWISFGMIVSGYLEIIYWSSPTFFFGGANAEYTTLLVNKIIITTIALALLLVIFLWYKKRFLTSRQ